MDFPPLPYNGVDVFGDNSYAHFVASTTVARPPIETNPKSMEKKKKRTLNLVKCTRCRIDKKNCTPVQRVWPSKCDRCAKSDFTCSAGKKVQRKTKHAALLSIDPEPQIAPQHNDQMQPEIDVDNWIFRLSYDKIIGMALNELHVLFSGTIQFCRERWHQYKQWDILKNTLVKDLSEFHDALKKSLFVTCRKMVAKPYPGKYPLLPPLLLHSLASLPQNFKCWICSPCPEEELITALAQFYDIGSEFLARQDRLSTDTLHRCKLGLSADTRVEQEVREIEQLSQRIQGKLRSDKFYRPLPFPNVFYSSKLVLRIHDSLPGYEREETKDCLGRGPLLQLLDALPEDGYLDENDLETFLYTAEVNQQDILNRTLLHVACLKKKEGSVKVLLKQGADPYLTTHTKHLPLHYAAAAGSSEMCKMILAEGYDELRMDAPDHFNCSALYYAVESGDKATVETLLEHPLYGNLALRDDHNRSNDDVPSTLLVALHNNDIEIMEMLVKNGASYKATRYGETVLESLQYHIGTIVPKYEDYSRWQKLYLEAMVIENAEV